MIAVLWSEVQPAQASDKQVVLYKNQENAIIMHS